MVFNLTQCQHEAVHLKIYEEVEYLFSDYFLRAHGTKFDLHIRGININVYIHFKVHSLVFHYEITAK